MPLSQKQVKEQARAMMIYKTLQEAYNATHPKTKLKRNNNQSKMANNPKVLEEYERLLEKQKPITIDRDHIVSFIKMIEMNWMEGKESTSNLLRALELLSKLVPDFVNREEVTKYSTMSYDDLKRELDFKIKRFSVN